MNHGAEKAVTVRDRAKGMLIAVALLAAIGSSAWAQTFGRPVEETPAIGAIATTPASPDTAGARGDRRPAIDLLGRCRGFDPGRRDHRPAFCEADRWPEGVGTALGGLASHRRMARYPGEQGLLRRDAFGTFQRGERAGPFAGTRGYRPAAGHHLGSFAADGQCGRARAPHLRGVSVAAVPASRRCRPRRGILGGVRGRVAGGRGRAHRVAARFPGGRLRVGDVLRAGRRRGERVQPGGSEGGRGPDGENGRCDQQVASRGAAPARSDLRIRRGGERRAGEALLHEGRPRQHRSAGGDPGGLADHRLDSRRRRFRRVGGQRSRLAGERLALQGGDVAPRGRCGRPHGDGALGDVPRPSPVGHPGRVHRDDGGGRGVVPPSTPGGKVPCTRADRRELVERGHQRAAERIGRAPLPGQRRGEPRALPGRRQHGRLRRRRALALHPRCRYARAAVVPDARRRPLGRVLRRRRDQHRRWFAPQVRGRARDHAMAAGSQARDRCRRDQGPGIRFRDGARARGRGVDVPRSFVVAFEPCRVFLRPDHHRTRADDRRRAFGGDPPGQSHRRCSAIDPDHPSRRRDGGEEGHPAGNRARSGDGRDGERPRTAAGRSILLDEPGRRGSRRRGAVPRRRARNGHGRENGDAGTELVPVGRRSAHRRPG